MCQMLLVTDRHLQQLQRMSLRLALMHTKIKISSLLALGRMRNLGFLWEDMLEIGSKWKVLRFVS